MYRGSHQQSWTALVTALTLLSKGVPVTRDGLGPHDYFLGVERSGSLLGLIGAIGSRQGSVQAQFRSRFKRIIQGHPRSWRESPGVQDFRCSPCTQFTRSKAYFSNSPSVPGLPVPHSRLSDPFITNSSLFPNIMASRSTTQPSQATPKSPFFQQRDALVGEIAIVCLPLAHSHPSYLEDTSTDASDRTEPRECSSKHEQAQSLTGGRDCRRQRIRSGGGAVESVRRGDGAGAWGGG